MGRCFIFPFVKRLCLCCCALFLAMCGRHGIIHAKKTFFRMDTATNVTIAVEKARNLNPVWNSIDSLLKHWEEHFSQTSKASEVLTFNTRNTPCAAVSAEFRSILEKGLAYGDTTHGAFDITVLPIMELWGFGEGEQTRKAPSPEALAAAMRNVDYRKVRLTSGHDTACCDSMSVKVDAGGMAGGFVLRELACLLDRYGLCNYLVDYGGDIILRGRRSDGRQWRIGIRHPRREGILGTIELPGGSIVTSGDYERFWMQGDRRIHHIMDTKTGTSCLKNQSITIGGPDPVENEILAKGLFCRSAGSILAFVNMRERLECVVVDSAGAVHMSDGWRNKVNLEGTR